MLTENVAALTVRVARFSPHMSCLRSPFRAPKPVPILTPDTRFPGGVQKGFPVAMGLTEGVPDIF